VYQQKIEKSLGDVITFQAGGTEGAIKQKGHIHLLADFLPVVTSKIIRIDKRKRKDLGSLENLVDKVRSTF
jgi:hypothetical protein